MFGVLAIGQGQGIAKAFGLLAALGVCLAIRGYGVAASTQQGALTVYGFLRSRTIQRAQIIEITDSATVLWKNSHGHKRWTPVWAFKTQPGTLRYIAEHHSDCLRQLQRWATAS